VRPEQRFDLALQFGIIAAGTSEEPPAVICRSFEGVLKQLLDAIPPLRLVDH